MEDYKIIEMKESNNNYNILIEKFGVRLNVEIYAPNSGTAIQRASKKIDDFIIQEKNNLSNGNIYNVSNDYSPKKTNENELDGIPEIYKLEF